MALLKLPEPPRGISDPLVRDYLDVLRRTLTERDLRSYQREEIDRGITLRAGDGTLLQLVPAKKTVLNVSVSGATVTATDLIPPAEWLVGVWAKNLTAVTGTLTTYLVGTASLTNAWGEMTLGLYDESDEASWNDRQIALQPVPLSVVLTAVGGTFSAGTVELTVWTLQLRTRRVRQLERTP